MARAHGHPGRRGGARLRRSRAHRAGRAGRLRVRGGPGVSVRSAGLPPVGRGAAAWGPAVKTIVDRALVYGRMIKFSHSVFALPFALASAAVAANGRVPWRELPWIVAAMVGARSAAMGFNRLAD